MTQNTITPREKFIMALEGKQPPGRVPHFELIFFLTMEAFGRVHPRQRYYKQWNQMSQTERDLHIRDVADIYVTSARAYEHSGIFYTPSGGWDHETDVRCVEQMREISGMEFYLTMHGDATYSIPSGEHMMEFVSRLADEPQAVKDEADRRVDERLEIGQKWQGRGLLDGFTLCSDYCYNDNPFLSPAMFDEFITPYLRRLIAGYREMGFYCIYTGMALKRYELMLDVWRREGNYD
jgi:uroporphyrinogen decarboxylase